MNATYMLASDAPMYLARNAQMPVTPIALPSRLQLSANPIIAGCAVSNVHLRIRSENAVACNADAGTRKKAKGHQCAAAARSKQAAIVLCMQPNQRFNQGVRCRTAATTAWRLIKLSVTNPNKYSRFSPLLAKSKASEIENTRSELTTRYMNSPVACSIAQHTVYQPVVL